MRTLAWFNILIIAALGAGCAHYPENPPLTDLSPNKGYRYQNIRFEPTSDKPFVILAFSGGGTRAAAFSFGLMEELNEVKYTTNTGETRRLLDDVEIISSVSGGSFTSAYYTLFPEKFFTSFQGAFLYRDIQKELVERLINPINLVKVASPNFSRIDMASDFYNETIFERKTFGDLLKKPMGTSPFLVLNATNISIGHQFEFNQDQFDLLCSDLSGVDVARAVAASSNFPIAFAPLTLNNYKDSCGALPKWVKLALDKDQNTKQRYGEALAAQSYRDPGRKFTHLLDGGLSDNLGLRGPIQAVTTTDSAWSILHLINKDNLSKLIVIAANAKTTKHRDWDASSTPPGLGAVLDVTTSGPMDDVSADSVEMISEHFKDMKQLGKTVDSCNAYVSRSCPGISRISNPLTTDFSFTELTFDDIADPHLRTCLQELPTSFALPKRTVDLLRISAKYLLMNSDDFVNGMKRLDPNWTPQKITIDKRLIDDVCGSREAGVALAK